MALTYEPIATTTLTSSTSTVTFSSISATYTDLVVVTQIVGTTGSNIGLRFNNTAGSGYSNTTINGNGTSASTARDTNSAYIPIDGLGYPSSGHNSTVITNIPNYANTSVFKTLVSQSSNPQNGTSVIVGLWQSTTAINRLDFFVAASGNMGAGSTFTVYGVKAA